MAPYLMIALIGLLYILFFGLLSYFRREGVSMRFILESLVLTALATAAVWATGSDLNPALFVLVLYLATMRVRVLVEAGNYLARRGNFEAAGLAYNVAERLWPDESGRLIVKMNRGVMAVHQKETDRAVAMLREVLSAENSGYLGTKSTAACHYNLGVAYLRQGQDGQATLEFNKVIEDWPMTEYAKYAGIALERRKRAVTAAQTPVEEPPVDKALQ